MRIGSGDGVPANQSQLIGQLAQLKRKLTVNFVVEHAAPSLTGSVTGRLEVKVAAKEREPQHGAPQPKRRSCKPSAVKVENGADRRLQAIYDKEYCRIVEAEAVKQSANERLERHFFHEVLKSLRNADARFAVFWLEPTPGLDIDDPSDPNPSKGKLPVRPSPPSTAPVVELPDWWLKNELGDQFRLLISSPMNTTRHLEFMPTEPIDCLLREEL